MESKTQSNLLTGSASPQILSINFNHKGDLFTVSTTEGFLVYQTSSKKLLSKTTIEGGVRTAQVMTPVGDAIGMAFVGTGKNLKYPKHKVVFWVTGKAQPQSEINFSDTLGVVTLKADGGVLVAGLSNHIRGFSLKDLSKIFQINTCENPKGLFAITCHKDIVSVASPNIQPGTVHLSRF